jgi:RNA polymerase sigma-70 factor, ECF subfamily
MDLNTAAFRDVVETHQRMVFSLALRVTGEYGAAEEVAQDVFMELHRSAGKLADGDHMKFWLRRVTVHRATDAIRKRGRQPESSAEEWDDGYGGIGSLAGAAEAFRVTSAMEARLEELLGSLPETLRVPIVLRYQEDMLPEEIAELLKQPIATVKSHLQRGLKLMRRKADVTMKEYKRERD